MSPRLSRTQAEAVVGQLIQIKQNLNRDIEALIAGLQPDGTMRSVRNYDQPTPDPEEIAERWGVDLTDDPEDVIPEWVISRYGHLMNDSHPENP